MKTILPAFLVVFALFLVSCEKDEPKCHSVSESSPEFLSYWHFPKDSYWVYKLEGSANEYDTVRVVAFDKKYFKPDEFAPRLPCKMVYTQTLSHSNETYFTDTLNNPNRLEKYEAQGLNLFVDRTINISRFPSAGPIFNLPIQIGRTLQTNVFIADTSDVVTPMQTFSETVEIRNRALLDSSDSQFAKSYFYTKDVGITKRVYSKNQVWVLVDYFINK